jgi:hypothetical protein
MADWFVQAHHHCPALPPCHSSAGLMEVGVGVVDPDADTDFETGQVADGHGVGKRVSVSRGTRRSRPRAMMMTATVGHDAAGFPSEAGDDGSAGWFSKWLPRVEPLERLGRTAQLPVQEATDGMVEAHEDLLPQPALHGSTSLVQVEGTRRVVDAHSVSDAEARQRGHGVRRRDQAKPLGDHRRQQPQLVVELLARSDALCESSHIDDRRRRLGWARRENGQAGTRGLACVATAHGHRCGGYPLTGWRSPAARACPRRRHAGRTTRPPSACAPWRCSSGWHRSARLLAATANTRTPSAAP